MHFHSWEPLYLEILDDFGFSRDLDEEAGKLLSVLLNQSKQVCMFNASALVLDRKAVVCGNAPCLHTDLEELLDSRSNQDVFIAADGATSVLMKSRIVPKIIVTDLDGNIDDILRANEMGSLIVVHAHGDNIDKLKEYVPLLRNFIGTTQCRPHLGLHNFGGFTDGDRSVFLARHLGASEITLIGFDFEDKSVTPRKQKKLAWAKKLVSMAINEVTP
jgi:uncharacterized Rossmann fold enzyme